MTEPYNGYSSVQRNAIIGAYKRMHGQAFLRTGPCAVCGDTERAPDSWHSEDYSRPHIFDPPATYLVCRACHGRIHKRFNEPPQNWALFLYFLDSGGFGREYAKLYSTAQRDAWATDLREQRAVALPVIRPRATDDREWWRALTLDRESRVAAWARPRPLRPRPDREIYERALDEIVAKPAERELLAFHASRPRRSATMRTLAAEVLNSASPTRANLAYGRFARRLCEALNWDPDKRRDGSSIWMTVVAEGWQPAGREYEWVLIPTLAEMFAKARRQESRADRDSWRSRATIGP